MAENDTTTSSTGTQNPPGSTSDPAAAASGGDTGNVSTLESRLSGQTAKVNILLGESKAKDARIKELEQALADAQGGITSADDAAQKLVAAKDKEIAKLVAQNKLTSIQAQYPETFAELGEDATNLTAEKLASMEARLKGGKVEDAGGEEPPTPRGNTSPRTGQEPAKPKTSDDILAEMRAAPPPEWWPTPVGS